MLRNGTPMIVTAVAATILLVGCASNGATIDGATPNPAPPATHVPGPSSEARSDDSVGEMDEVGVDVDAGRPQALAACRVIQDRGDIPIPTLTDAASRAKAAAEINPRWTELADAIVGMRDHSAKYEGVTDRPNEESLQFHTDSLTMQDLCRGLLGTTVFAP